MSAVELQAEHLRQWLKSSRIDGYTIECTDFKTIDEYEEVSYSIHVTVRNSAKETVGALAFKILYPWLKLYPCHLKPEAQGKGLTCQMYMVPMAFAAEDERIEIVKAKRVDATLRTKFGFDERGVLQVGEPGVRDHLLTVMQKCYDESKNLRKRFATRLARARVFAVTDGIRQDWSDKDPYFVTIGPTNSLTGGPFNLSLDDPQLWANVATKANYVPENWRTVVFDQLELPIPDDLLSSAVAALVDRVAGQGGDFWVHPKTDPRVGHHLESYGYSKTTTCDKDGCRTVDHVCNNDQCSEEFYTYKLPSSSPKPVKPTPKTAAKTPPRTGSSSPVTFGGPPNPSSKPASKPSKPSPKTFGASTKPSPKPSPVTFGSPPRRSPRTPGNPFGAPPQTFAQPSASMQPFGLPTASPNSFAQPSAQLFAQPSGFP